LSDIPSRPSHLEHFFHCQNCGGYFNAETSYPKYEETYFAERAAPAFLGSAIGKIFLIFPFLYALKIKKLISKNSWILDYGCGGGKMVSYLRKRGFCVDGFDPSPSAVFLAQKNNLPVYGAIPDKKYGLITFWHSLEHTNQPLRDFEACKKYLAKNAKVLIAIPNGDSIEAAIARSRWFCYDWPYHRVHFTPESLSMMLRRAGFRVVSIDYFNPGYSIPSLAQTFLNFFMPKNALYSLVANRRAEEGGTKLILLGILSVFLIVLFSPLLAVVFFISILLKRPGTIILIAELV